MARVFSGKAQVVHLLAHLRDQRHAHRQRAAEEQRAEGAALATAVSIQAGLGAQLGHQPRVGLEHDDVGQHQQHQQRQPQRLRPHLKAADRIDTVRDHGYDHPRADQVAPGGRNVEGQLQRVGHAASSAKKMNVKLA